jgi:fatty acyl-CoA reductase
MLRRHILITKVVVTASYKEPMESWVDSFATLGLVAFMSLGVIRVVPSKGSCPMELVPVDLVISAMIACAWDISHKDPIPVYNYVSSIDNPTTFGDFLKIHKTQMCRYPLSKAVWAPQFTCITNPVWYSLSKILYNRTLALFYDFCHILTLKKPQMLGRIIKLEEIVDSIALFLNRSWKFSNGNVKKLWDRMNDEDRELFPFDIRMVNWETYYRNLQKGIRVYLLNDPLSTLPEARIRMER